MQEVIRGSIIGLYCMCVDSESESRVQVLKVDCGKSVKLALSTGAVVFRFVTIHAFDRQMYRCRQQEPRSNAKHRTMVGLEGRRRVQPCLTTGLQHIDNDFDV